MANTMTSTDGLKQTDYDAREFIKCSRLMICRVYLGLSKFEYLVLKRNNVQSKLINTFEQLNRVLSKNTDYSKSMLKEAIENFNKNLTEKKISAVMIEPFEIIHRDITTGLGFADTYKYHLLIDKMVLDDDKPVIHLYLTVDAPKFPTVKKFTEEELISGFENHYSFYVNGNYQKDEDMNETFGLVFSKLVAVKQIGDKPNDFIKRTIIEL